MTDNSKTKSTRKPNWGETEMEVLAGAMKEASNLVFAKFTPSLTREVKANQWSNVVMK